eukprot:14096-Heterococcus_DN1.PRE.1
MQFEGRSSRPNICDQLNRSQIRAQLDDHRIYTEIKWSAIYKKAARHVAFALLLLPYEHQVAAQRPHTD